LCVFSWAKNLVLNRAAPTTWGVFAPAFFVAVELTSRKVENIAHVIRLNVGRVVFVCDVGGSGGGVENDLIPFIYSGSSA
jgi:hypothetical protein